MEKCISSGSGRSHVFGTTTTYTSSVGIYVEIFFMCCPSDLAKVTPFHHAQQKSVSLQDSSLTH